MRYVKKIAGMIITLLIVSFLIFSAFAIIPGDAAINQLGTQATESAIALKRAELGLDKPFLTRYFNWLSSCIKGDFGISYSYRIPVSEMILDKLPITFAMSAMAFVLIVAISIPLGIYFAKHAGKRRDKAFFVFNQFTMSIPAFFLGMIMTYVFGLCLKLFRPGGFISYKKDFWGFIGYMIFPAIAIAIPKIAMCVKLLRSSILEEAGKDYVRTAYSRGNSTMQVMYKHVLRNAIIPIVTFLGMAITDMIAGSIVVEQVFGIPGVGRILLTSISNRDYPVVEAVILMIAFLIIIVNFVVDALYRVLDPRTREDK